MGRLSGNIGAYTFWNPLGLSRLVQELLYFSHVLNTRMKSWIAFLLCCSAAVIISLYTMENSITKNVGRFPDFIFDAFFSTANFIF
jgi:hypothetical protein